MEVSKPAPLKVPTGGVKEKKRGETPREKRRRIWKVLREKIGAIAQERKLLFAKNAEYCRLCILDAFQGRLSNGLANNSKKSAWIYTIFCIQTSEILFRSVIGACLFHTISLFFEPENACSNSMIYTGLQVLVLAIYAFDIALKMSYEGVKEYFSHDWQQLYFIVVVCGVLDLVFNHCTLMTNPLRPVVGVLRARKGRRFFEVLKKMMPGMTHSLVPLLFFIVLVMVASGLLYDTTIAELASSVFTSYNWFFLIFTNDNFDRILPQDVVVNMSYLIFFFPCIYVGQRFLLSLIIGDTYETYKAFVKKQLKKEKLKEMQGLVKAFSALDVQKCGTITALQWKECCKKYDPNIPDEAIALYFELLSGGNNTISVLQFLNMRSVLDFNLTLKSNQHDFFSNLYLPLWEKVQTAYCRVRVSISEKLVARCKQLLVLESQWEVLIKLNALDLIALCFSLSDYMLGPLRVPLLGEIFLSIGFALNVAYLAEFAIRLCACEGKVYMVHHNNNVSSHLFVLGVVGRVVSSVVASIYRLPPSTLLVLPFFPAAWGPAPSLTLRKATLLLRALRCFRVTNLNRDLRNFSMALLDVLPALIETFSFSFIVTYIFGALGNLLFGQYMEEWRTPLRAVVKAQQLTFMVNFLGSTEDAMEQVHPTAAIFFVCYLILSLAVSNIALSIIIELQNNMLAGKTSKDRDGQKAKLDLMFNKIKDQARARAVFQSTARMNFNNIVMSQFQSSDTRHFIADMAGEKELKMEDIKACQKYSTIDLIAHYSKEHRNHKDQHWEVDFLTAVGDSGLKNKQVFGPGDEIIQAGTPATKIYLIISGSVEFMEPDYVGQTYASAAHFVGQEALAPNAIYKYNCTAETETTVLAFTHEDITESLDAELCGCVLRMSIKSFARLEAALLEARRRASRVGSNLYAYLNDEDSVLEDTDEPTRSLASSRSDRSIRLDRGIERDDSFKLVGMKGFSFNRSSSSVTSASSPAKASSTKAPQATLSPYPSGDADETPPASRDDDGAEAPTSRQEALGSRSNSHKLEEEHPASPAE